MPFHSGFINVQATREINLDGSLNYFYTRTYIHYLYSAMSALFYVLYIQKTIYQFLVASRPNNAVETSLNSSIPFSIVLPYINVRCGCITFFQLISLVAFHLVLSCFHITMRHKIEFKDSWLE